MATIASLMERHDGKCFWCDQQCIIYPGAQNRPNAATRDHLFPQTDPRRNIPTQYSQILSCRKCNNERGALTFEDYAAIKWRCIRLQVADQFDFSSFTGRAA
jgi:hypothetical protein